MDELKSFKKGFWGNCRLGEHFGYLLEFVFVEVLNLIQFIICLDLDVYFFFPHIYYRKCDVFYRSFLYHLPWEHKMTMLARLANLSLNGVLNLIQFILLRTKFQLWNQLKPFLSVSVTSIVGFEWSELIWYSVKFFK